MSGTAARAAASAPPGPSAARKRGFGERGAPRDPGWEPAHGGGECRPCQPGHESCKGLGLRVSQGGRRAGVRGAARGGPGGRSRTAGGARAGARGRVAGALSESRAAGPGSRVPRPAGISSPLHAATRVGLGLAGEKQRPGRAGEGRERARGGGAGGLRLGWGVGCWGGPDLRPQGVQGRVLGKRERPGLSELFLKLGYSRVSLFQKPLGPKATGYSSVPPPPLSTDN